MYTKDTIKNMYCKKKMYCITAVSKDWKQTTCSTVGDWLSK